MIHLGHGIAQTAADPCEIADGTVSFAPGISGVVKVIVEDHMDVVGGLVDGGIVIKTAAFLALREVCAGGDHEQKPLLVQGSGKLLLANDEEKEFNAGDVVRFADKDVHGLKNDGDTEFVYISVTAPPIHFGYAYKDEK